MVPHTPPDDGDNAQQEQSDEEYVYMSEEEIAHMDSIIGEIWTLYNANTPLFTKDAMRRVARELALCRESASGSRKVLLPGINGVDYETVAFLPHMSSKTQPLRGPTWVINYRTIDRLTTRDVKYFSFEDAYLPMSIRSVTWRMGSRPEDVNDLHVSSTEELREVFYEIEREWKMSEYYKQLETALTAITTSLVLDKVIGLALGSLVWETRVERDCIIQHALISAIESILLRCGVLSSSPPCRYVQDPAYTQQDKHVLCSAGFTVLEDPEAFLTMDNSSVLVSIAPNIPVMQIVADICRPGVLLWMRKPESPRPLPPATSWTDPASPRVDKMLENEYYELKFPFHESFRDLVMYIRKA